MIRHIREYTMEELWGAGNTNNKEKQTRRNKLYCIYLGNKEYIATSQYGWFSVVGMENADIFTSIGEAEEFLRSYWIDGEIVEWYGPNKEYIEQMRIGRANE